MQKSTASGSQEMGVGVKVGSGAVVHMGVEEIVATSGLGDADG
jgi:hypothetical protein